ncbi:ribonuclease H-like domain-containing protein [Vararia minispora EC-137]|uniref:Ribonuclease H-like domain-containing protein n=1 Tax=Vararia minispora EC-137 TaxID=1314806 RepID=A0ACB8QDP0_9AGAM|nr:ribonuclease H-like domain-containing protein [Vararia minispora EC-137]
MVSVTRTPFVHFQTPSQAILSVPTTSTVGLTRSAATTVDASHPVPSRQLFDAFLVLDVEATCMPGSDFDYPNEIIEWPVLLLKWKDRDQNGLASTLEVAGQFRSFVRPTWRPKLSPFCTQLTGITQAQIDTAPTFPLVLSQFSSFLAEHGLIRPSTGERLVRFCWCTDGPFDIRDFVVKQCFISKIRMPYWLEGQIVDVRQTVLTWCDATQNDSRSQRSPFLRRLSPNIAMQLKLLHLSKFEGREHSGIDDTHNVARIVIELARRGVRLQANTFIRPGRRWNWMGKRGEILEDYIRQQLS